MVVDVSKLVDSTQIKSTEPLYLTWKGIFEKNPDTIFSISDKVGCKAEQKECSFVWDTNKEVKNGGYEIFVTTVDGLYGSNSVKIIIDNSIIYIVPDTTLPIIKINGESVVTVSYGSTFVDLGATATDNIDGDISSKIITTNSVNTNVAGNYTVAYNVKDNSNNSAIEVVRLVTVNNRPSSGGGGGGYLIQQQKAATNPIITPAALILETTPAEGQVLGATTFKFSKTLKKGMKSADVKELQERLRSEGLFTITPSINYFGVGTLKSVKDYQKAHKLTQDGIVGPKTILELNK
jgi:hypothetical protein